MAYASTASGFAPIKAATDTKGKGYFATLLADFRAYREAKAVMAQLNAMDARMLDDIGLTRYDIDMAAKTGDLPVRR